MVGDWSVSPAQNLLERDGESAKLKPRALDVLIYLANHVQSSDHRPTAQAEEAKGFLEDLLAVAESDYERLVLTDLAELNRMLRARGLPPIVAPGRPLVP